jgi:DNA primase
MPTFLEYVIEHCYGPPAFTRGDCSYWHCPFHPDEHPSFHTLPPKAGEKDRFKCFPCDAWGDEKDILKLAFPKDDYGQRVRRLEELRSEYRKQSRNVVLSLSRGGAGSWKRERANEIMGDLYQFFDSENEIECRRMLRQLHTFIEKCHSQNLQPLELPQVKRAADHIQNAKLNLTRKRMTHATVDNKKH